MLGLSPETQRFLAKLRNSKQIARELVVDIAALEYRGEVENITRRLETGVVAGMRVFFQELTDLLGDDAPLSARIGGTFGYPSWKPLTLAWVKRKGHASFFLHNPPRRRRKGAPLLPELRRANVERAFGRATVKREWTTAELRGASAREVVTDVKLSVQLFPNFPERSFSRVETRLKTQGVLSTSAVTKLIGKRAWHRSAVPPFMAFYSQVRIPRLITDVLRRRSTLGASAGRANITQNDRRLP